MSIDVLKDRLPDYAKDLRINLGIIAGSTALTPQQAWGTAVAAAVTAKHPDVLAAVLAEGAAHLTPEARDAAKGAAAIMGMNNVYYRFVHMMGDAAEYGAMPARLRMQLIGKPGVDQIDFELWCLAASAIAGCERCVQSHEAAVRQKGGTKEHVHEAVRIASVIQAVALTLATA